MSTGNTANDTLKAGVLRPEQASEMLAQALQEQAPIQLSLSENFLEPCVWGVLVREEDGKLLMEIRRLASIMDGHQDVTCLYGTVELLDSRYFFDVHLLNSQQEWKCDSLLEFNWPMMIAVEERRRSRRRQFKEATNVILVITTDGSEKTFDAALFNVSFHGIAFKISEDKVSALDIGSKFKIRMRIGSTPELFEEEVAMVSKTPAGSPGQVVLGMDFAAEPSQRFCDAVRMGDFEARPQ